MPANEIRYFGQPPGRFAISLVTNKYYDQVIEFMAKYFFPYETVCRNLKLWTEGSVNATMQKVLYNSLKQGFSLMAVDKHNNDLLVGTLTSQLHTHFSYKLLGEQILSSKSAIEPNWKIFSAILSPNVFEITKSSTIYELDQLTIRPGYSGLGLGKELLRLSSQRGFSLGHKTQFSTATCEASYITLCKLGFDTCIEFPLKSFNSEGYPQQPLFDDPDTKIRVLFKYY